MEINIGSGYGLVLSGNNPLPEPMLTQMYIAILRQSATTGWIAACIHNIMNILVEIQEYMFWYFEMNNCGFICSHYDGINNCGDKGSNG